MLSAAVLACALTGQIYIGPNPPPGWVPATPIPAVRDNFAALTDPEAKRQNALGWFNSGRAALGAPPLRRHPALDAAAQVRAQGVAAGDYRHSTDAELHAYGFPWGPPPPGSWSAAMGSRENTGEGMQPSRPSPQQYADTMLAWNRTQPREPHAWDFRANWTHVGFGWAGRVFVVSYGYAPGSP